MILTLFSLSHLKCDVVCPSSCYCNSGAVDCGGYHITDIPKPMPVKTVLLRINDTNMNVINERSLADLDLVLRFSLTHSHLHTIHPKAFHVAPQLLSLKLSSNNLSVLPTRIFSPLVLLDQLFLDGNQLESITRSMFEGLANLEQIDLNSNKLCNLSLDVFNGFTKLTTLNLGKNSIKRLPPTIFHSLTKLKELVIYYNEIEVLEAGVFDGLVNLEQLKLHHNQITSITPQVFWSLRNLTMLTLSNNRLEAIPERSFYNMPNLEKLTIYKNPLLSLPDQLMGCMPYIREFYLYSTNLKTVPGNLFANMSGLISLNLHFNIWLSELPSDLFCCLPNVEKLSLKSNNLVHLHPQLFSKIPKLKILFLGDNQLQSLPESIFHALRQVRSIDLQNNHLKNLPGDIFLSNAVLKFLAMYGNPWDCNCSIRDISKWIRQNQDVVLDRDRVTCQSPVYKPKRSVSSLTDEDFIHCNATTFKSYLPTQKEWQKTTKPSYTISTSRHRPGFTSESTPLPTTTSPAPQKVTQQVTFLAIRPPTIPPVITTLSSSIQTPTSSLPDAGTILTTETPPGNVSRVFYDTLVVEEGREYVHHTRHKGSVFVWFLPSGTTFAWFLMFCHVILVATGLFFIFAAMYSMHRLNKIMDDLAQGCQI